MKLSITVKIIMMDTITILLLKISNRQLTCSKESAMPIPICTAQVVKQCPIFTKSAETGALRYCIRKLKELLCRHLLPPSAGLTLSVSAKQMMVSETLSAQTETVSIQVSVTLQVFHKVSASPEALPLIVAHQTSTPAWRRRDSMTSAVTSPHFVNNKILISSTHTEI